ncbi:MAG TPA: response regulator [Candidatus Acidoferrales bacterium]|nr:response regulator [Candidatus Acidoferrales bacterium]
MLDDPGEALRKSDERVGGDRIEDDRLTKVVEHAPEGIFIQRGGRFAYLNAAALRLYGAASAEQLLGQPVVERVHPLWRHLAAQRILPASELQPRAPLSEEKHLKLDGTVFDAEVSAAPLAYEDSAGSFGSGEVVFVRDITRRKQAEETERLNGALLRSRAEDEAAKLREQLLHARKLESIGRLAGGVAHDFNNLLTIINGYSDLLLGRLTPNDPMRKDVTEIRKAGDRAAALCNQLLVPGRKQIPRPSGLNLNGLIADVEKLLVRVIGEDIRLATVLRPSVGQVQADAGLLHQVLMDLAMNARDAMPGGGTLRIETEDVELGEGHAAHHPDVKPGPYVQLKFSDTGIGMTKDVMAHLFEPFFTTKTPGEGRGLGLAAVYGIVKQSGGAILAHSETGEGTTFTIYLRRLAGEAAGLEAPRSDPEKPDAAALGGTETILVVEHHDEIRQLAHVVLSRYGYRVIEAGSGDEALLHAERHAGPIHLMLSEIAMPGMTGQELVDRMKPLRSGMSVVFMSGDSDRGVGDQGTGDQGTGDQGIPDVGVSYLSKPFSPETLAGKVREALGAPRPAGTILVVDDEPEIRDLLGEILAGAGYRAVQATDGKDALKRLDTADVDLVITDLAMPEQDGLETIRILHKTRPRLKIIAISGKFDAGFLRAAELLGAHASLAKPIRPDALLDTVRRVMVDIRGTRGSGPRD